VDRPPSIRIATDQEALEPVEERALEADRNASFETFVVANYTRLFQALCVVIGDRFEAEDVAQEAFVRVLERWDRVHDVDDPAGYLFRTAMNVFRSRLRRTKVAILKAFTPRSGTDSFAAIEDREIVVGGLRKLSANQRAALVTTAMLGYSSEEAAKMLGTTASNVRARSTRARAALREAIGDDR
jgi:RNA polymerase sigma-70 factor (ECF subfamily)